MNTLTHIKQTIVHNNKLWHSFYIKSLTFVPMKLKPFYILFGLSLAIVFSACKKKDEPFPVVDHMPAFFNSAEWDQYGQNAPAITLIAGTSDNVRDPWDIDFHPTRVNELWILNKGIDQTGGSTVTVSNTGMANQSSDFRRDGNAWHFMAFPSALSFSRENGNWANTAEIQDANRRGGQFTGPSLWSSDMNIYAKPSGGNGSHLDMLHGSPYSMGIESDKDNAFWVFDGYNRHICWYDFAQDHGPGNSDHDDGRIRRYVEVQVSRSPGIPSHLVMHRPSGWLYIADPANSRIIRMNTKSGNVKGSLPPLNGERLAENVGMENVEWNVFKDNNLKKPAGIEVVGDVLYVSDYETGFIIAYNVTSGQELGRIQTGKSKIMGLKADSQGRLHFVANGSNEVYRIDAQ